MASQVSETISLEEIAKIIDVPKKTVKEQFNRGKLLEYVPRPLGDGEWVIYRKDFEAALQRKRAKLEKEIQEWDSYFETDAINVEDLTQA